MRLVSFVCLRAWTGPDGKGAGFRSTKGGVPQPLRRGVGSPPVQPPKLSNTPRVTHWLAAAPVVAMGEVEEARGNLQSLRGKVQRWEAKLGRCRELGDVSGGIAAGDKSLEEKRWLREAQRAVEELEGRLPSMGTGDNWVKVEEEGDDNVQQVGVKGHPGGTLWFRRGQRRGGQSLMGRMNPPSCTSPSGCPRGWVQAWQPNLPPSPSQRRWCPPPPPLGCLHPENPPSHHLHPSVVVATISLEVVPHQGPKPTAAGAGRMGMHQAGALVTWVTGPGSGRIAPLPND